MLQKFALAVKTKTVEFFAEEEDEDDDEQQQPISAASTAAAAAAVDEVITGQRVVVIKPDRPISSSAPKCIPSSDHRKTLISSLFTTISSFHAAYLQLQTAHEPFNREGIESADKIAVNHLRRLTDMKTAYKDMNFTTHIANSQVEENQSMLRILETVFNRLQCDIDEKDANAGSLKQELGEIEKLNGLMERRLDAIQPSSYSSFLTIGVFESVLKDCWKEAQRFSKVLIHGMKKSGWKLDLVASSIHPTVDHGKKTGHYCHALLSLVCLEMFSSFGSTEFGSSCSKDETSRRNSLAQFVEHLNVDAIEVLDTMPESEFALFCKNKYRKLVHPDLEVSLFGDTDWWDPVLRSWQPLNPLYESYITMCSSIWLLRKLALAFDRPVEIFQVREGADFSMVYMESVVRAVGSDRICYSECRPKVGFTVFPGFLVGSTIIQCKVYLNY